MELGWYEVKQSSEYRVQSKITSGRSYTLRTSSCDQRAEENTLCDVAKSVNSEASCVEVLEAQITSSAKTAKTATLVRELPNADRSDMGKIRYCVYWYV